ncbi:MAG: GNAT family N-acetyltransferase [Bacteroidota bacterium]
MAKLPKLELDREAWAAFVNDCPGATFFHTPQWYEVWEAYDDYRIEAQLLRLPSGREVLLPLASKPMLGGLSRVYHSSPAGTYGGYLCREPLTAADRQQLYQHLCSFSTLLLQEAPLVPSVLAGQGGEEDFTQLIDLEGGGGVVANWSRNHRRSLKKGLATDYHFRAAQSLEDWNAYFEMYQDNLERWGDRVMAIYNWPLFEILAQLPKTHCRLWLIEQEGRLASGAICFYFNQNVIPWHEATLSAHLRLRPTFLLYYHVIQDAIQKGFRSYDFSPSAGIRGVIQFKEGFRAKPKAVPFLNWRSDSIKFIDWMIRPFRKEKTL